MKTWIKIDLKKNDSHLWMKGLPNVWWKQVTDNDVDTHCGIITTISWTISEQSKALHYLWIITCAIDKVSAQRMAHAIDISGAAYLGLSGLLVVHDMS